MKNRPKLNSNRSKVNLESSDEKTRKIIEPLPENEHIDDPISIELPPDFEETSRNDKRQSAK
ncbi:MAG: hypothetical protein R3C03_23180 [Pirellulaceae bacterium]